MQTGKYILTTIAMCAGGTLLAFPQARADDVQSGKPAASQQQSDESRKGAEVTTKGVESSSANMVLVGELVDARDVTLKGLNEEKHRLLKVKPGNGAQTVIVDIGRQDAAVSFGLVKGDRVIAVGKSARINERPVLFAKSIGELYPVGRVGSVARDDKQMTQDNSARGAAPTTDSSAGASMSDPLTLDKSSSSSKRSSTDGAKQPANGKSTQKSAANVDVPDARKVDEVVVFFDTNNLGTDQYGPYDRDFVWVTVDPAYSTWNPAGDSVAWNDNWEKPHWDVWGYDDADEWGLFDW